MSKRRCKSFKIKYFIGTMRTNCGLKRENFCHNLAREFYGAPKLNCARCPWCFPRGPMKCGPWTTHMTNWPPAPRPEIACVSCSAWPVLRPGRVDRPACGSWSTAAFRPRPFSSARKCTAADSRIAAELQLLYLSDCLYGLPPWPHNLKTSHTKEARQLDHQFENFDDSCFT